MAQHTSGTYAERLWPSITFFVALLLIIPALTVLFTPFSLQAGIIAGVIAYVLVCGIFLLSTRKLSVVDGKFIAGGVAIDVDLLGEIETLDKQELSVAIGRRLDARAFLCVSGWVHKGIKIQLNDPEDPTPYWVVTTRKPQTLKTAILNAQAARV